MPLVPGPPQRLAAAVGQWADSFCLCSSAPSPPVQMWSSSSGTQAPPASAPQTPSSKKAVMLVHQLKHAECHLKKLQYSVCLFVPQLKRSDQVSLAYGWILACRFQGEKKKREKKEKYLQPQNLLHQRIKSLDASYLATSQRAKTQPHAQSSSTQIQRTERQTGHFYIYGDGIMWKLGLNKAPVDRVQEKELSLGMNWCSWSLERAMPQHTQARNNPELLHNDASNRHSVKYIYNLK